MHRVLLHIGAILFAICLFIGPPRTVFAAGGADAQSRAIVQAADRFLATLTVDQRRRPVFEWANDAQRHNWSNLPEGMNVQRGGMKWGDLDTSQRAALMTLLGAVLSEEGVDVARLHMLADNTLVRPGGRVNFGEDLYFISFVGQPSTSSPWMLQFGGHHLAINATMSGDNVTLSPTLTGGQPLRFNIEGRQVYLTENEINAAHALMASLTTAQRTQAIVSDQRTQLQLGPGQDHRTLAAEGVRVSTFNAAQRARLTALIAARLDILNADDRAPLMRDITSRFEDTTFGWWGPVADGELAYWRVVGPTIALEYSPQGPEHVHAIYRNPQNDYGAGWARN